MSMIPPPSTGLPEPASLQQLRRMLNPTPPPSVTGPANTANFVRSLYAAPEMVQNSASSVGNLYATGPQPALPPGGSTPIYNNPALVRRMSAESRLMGQASSATGAARPAAGVTRGAIGTGAAETAAAGGAAAAAGRSSRFLNPGRPITLGGRQLMGGGLRAGVARGIGGAVLGGIGGDLLDQANIGGEGSFADRALPGAARGAGMGAAFGPWGAAIGAGLGGAATAFDVPILSDLFGGGEEAPADLPPAPQRYEEATNRISEAFAISGMPEDRAMQFFNTIEANLAMYTPEEQEAAMEALLTPDPETGIAPLQADAQAFMAEAQAQTQQLSPTDIANIQAQVGQYLQPFQEQIINTGNLAAAAMTNPSQMGGLSPQYQQALMAQARTQQANAQRMAASIAAQGQVLPAITAQQHAISQAFQQPRDGGGGDLAALLEQIGA